jgi:hypothetical protein
MMATPLKRLIHRDPFIVLCSGRDRCKINLIPLNTPKTRDMKVPSFTITILFTGSGNNKRLINRTELPVK